MKFKLAAIALIASTALSCNTSFGCDLLDRMLGRAGCSSCQAPTAPSCGCSGGGLMDKIMSKAAGCGCGGSDMLTYDANMSCGPVGTPCGAASSSCGCGAAASTCDGGCGLLSKVRGNMGGGCGCEAAAPVSDCGCSAPAPMADCGCSAPAPMADCGCSAPAPMADCGCSAPAPVADCGCDAAPASSCDGGGCGLFSKLRGSMSGGCGCEAAAPVSDCGCSAPAPMADCGCSAPAPAPVADCGCDAAPASSCDGGGCGLFSKVRSSMGGGCGCEAAAPMADCGCSAPAPAPVADCGCSAPVADCGCGSAPAFDGAGLGIKPSMGLFSRFQKSDCGCGSPAPAVSSCGCNAEVSGGFGSSVAHAGARGKLTLLDRLRGNRIPRTREGVVIGSSNDGCNSPCPNQPAHAGGSDCGCGAPAEAAPCTSCGEGASIYSEPQPHNSGCTTCQGSAQGEIIYGDGGAVAAPVMMDSNGATNAAPIVPGGDSNSTEGVIESGVRDAVKEAVEGASPVVDPAAFVPARRTTVGS